jgi:hypothetical protein
MKTIFLLAIFYAASGSLILSQVPNQLHIDPQNTWLSVGSVIAIIVSFLSAVVSIVAATWYIRGWMVRVESRLTEQDIHRTRIERTLDHLTQYMEREGHMPARINPRSRE